MSDRTVHVHNGIRYSVNLVSGAERCDWYNCTYNVYNSFDEPERVEVVSDQGSVYNCKNHPNLRWFDTKPNGRLVFSGEITEDGKLREAYLEPGNPINKLRHYLNGKNPYNPDLPLAEPFTWDRLKDFMASIERIQEKGWVFECDCPASDLVRLPDETYATVHDRPHLPVL